ncbi:hypothetical protein C8Q79DRAFT_480361 [Trametes meyenii]|nr:hypothetical protein C8Q79DRAFT_480361 [Trametes meyenii]
MPLRDAPSRAGSGYLSCQLCRRSNAPQTPFVAAPHRVTAHSDRSSRRCAHACIWRATTRHHPRTPNSVQQLCNVAHSETLACPPASTRPLCMALSSCQPVTPSPPHLARSLLPGRSRMASPIHRDPIFSARAAALPGLSIRPVARHCRPRFDGDVPMSRLLALSPPRAHPRSDPSCCAPHNRRRIVRPHYRSALRMALHPRCPLPVARCLLLVARNSPSPCCQSRSTSIPSETVTALSGALPSPCLVRPARALPPLHRATKQTRARACACTRAPPRWCLDRPVTRHVRLGLELLSPSWIPGQISLWL